MDREQRSSSIDQQSPLAETQREPVHILPSDFGGYALHPEHNLNQDSTLKQGSDDMISRNQQQQQKQPSNFDFSRMKNEPVAEKSTTTPLPGYQTDPVLTHDKDIVFFGDSNVADEYQPASRSTLDQDGLQRGSISTLPSAGAHRRSSARQHHDASVSSVGNVDALQNQQSQGVSSSIQANDTTKDGDRKPSLMDMATAAVASVGAVGAAAASGVSHAFMGHNATSSGDYNFVKSQESNMPSSWPSSSHAAVAADNDTSVLGISSTTIEPQEGPGAKNATNCNYEPAIHGQSACFYTKDNVCDECVKDKNHPFCENVKEPSIHGQNPSFYCQDEHLPCSKNEFMHQDLPVSNVEQSFAAHSQSPRSSLTIDDLPHGFPHHGVLPVTNVEQCLNDHDHDNDQIYPTALDTDMSSSNQAPLGQGVSGSNQDNQALPSSTSNNEGVNKGLLAGGAGAGAGAAIGGLLSRNNNQAGQDQSKSLGNQDITATPQGNVPSKLDDSQLYENQDDITVPQHWSSKDQGGAVAPQSTLSNKQEFADATQNWDDIESQDDNTELPRTWGDQRVPVDPHLSTDTPSYGKQASNSVPHGYDGDEGITPGSPTTGNVTSVAPTAVDTSTGVLNQSYNPQLAPDSAKTDVSQGDPGLVNNFAAGSKTTDGQFNKGLLATAGGATAGALAGGALGTGLGQSNTTDMQQNNLQDQGLSTAPQTWLSNDDQENLATGNTDQGLSTDNQGLDIQNQGMATDQALTSGNQDQGLTSSTDQQQDITAGTQGWSNDQAELTTPQTAAINKDQDISKTAPWTDNQIEQGNVTAPDTWNDQGISATSNDQPISSNSPDLGGAGQDGTTSGTQNLDNNNDKHKTEKGLLAGGSGALAAAGGILGLNKHKQNKTTDDESFSSTKATTGKIVPDYRNQDEIKDRTAQRHENFKNIPDSLEPDRNHMHPRVGRKNSLTQGLKSKAAAVTGAFSNAARRLSNQGSSGSIKKDSIHVRRMSDAEIFKNQTLQDEQVEQKAFGNHEQAAFGGNSAFGNTSAGVVPPAPNVLRSAANTTNVPFTHDQNAIRTGTGNSVPLSEDNNVIHPAAATTTTSAPLTTATEGSELDRQATTNNENIDPLARDNVGDSDAARRISSGSDRLKYTGVNQDYARIPGIQSMKPTGTADVGDNGDVNVVKDAEEGKKAVPNMSSFVSGHVEARRGSIQVSVRRRKTFEQKSIKICFV